MLLSMTGCKLRWHSVSTDSLCSDIEHIWQTFWRLRFYRGGPVFMSALSGVDIALWDLKARRLNVPIYQLLGGKVRNSECEYL
jgi:galactonate dehydratase